MSYFCISYDLKEGQDYGPLIENLRHNKAVRAMESLWLLDIDSSAGGLRDHFKKYLPTPEQDKLMLVAFEEKPRFTKLFIDAVNWINARFP